MMGPTRVEGGAIEQELGKPARPRPKEIAAFSFPLHACTNQTQLKSRAAHTVPEGKGCELRIANARVPAGRKRKERQAEIGSRGAPATRIDRLLLRLPSTSPVASPSLHVQSAFSSPFFTYPPSLHSSPSAPAPPYPVARKGNVPLVPSIHAHDCASIYLHCGRVGVTALLTAASGSQPDIRSRSGPSRPLVLNFTCPELQPPTHVLQKSLDGRCRRLFWLVAEVPRYSSVQRAAHPPWFSKTLLAWAHSYRYSTPAVRSEVHKSDPSAPLQYEPDDAHHSSANATRSDDLGPMFQNRCSLRARSGPRSPLSSASR
ncbi:hypothetical protein P280DRAFT_527081 [Massarina eburnea CBS 473.64]|uniref:Uncharacterized protein n=1 Tax=Massarina eburnea CBS 473.64 TaxID=1395130 RepID=A0A6A6RXC2_9PLEO|nr:hypothetical protein P280DRAFT_527081 [Massarina eburnea CBS 473.64]